MDGQEVHWEKYGISAGIDAKDACVNCFKDTTLFNINTMTVLGWRLGYENDSGGITMIYP